MKFLRPTLLTLACLLASPGFADDLPSLGDASSAIVSQEQEYQLGRAWLGMLRGQVSQLSDPQLKDYVESSVYLLAETSQVQNPRLEFILINSRELNAFAAPGGIVGINGGLFLSALNESEYAAVLAHELAHLSQRHFARNIEAQRRMQVPMLAAMLTGIVIAAAGGGDAGIATIAGTQAAAIQEETRFSRAREQEADRIGIINLQKAGYDPEAMPNMFERLMRQYRFDAKPPEFLMDHPVTESRIADTRNRADQEKPGGKKDSLQYQLIRARVVLFYEESTGVAAKRFRAELDENPNSDPARYGLTLAQIKGSQFSAARETLKPLLSKDPNSITYNLAQAEIDVGSNKLADAQQRIDRMKQQFPDNYPLSQARVDLLLKENRPVDAGKDLEVMVKARPSDPDVWSLVADVRGLSGDMVGSSRARAEYFALTGDYKQAQQQLEIAKRRSNNNFQMASRIDARQKELADQEQLLKEMMN